MRALAAAVAAIVLACGIGLLIWSITPSSGSADQVLRAAVGALGAAHFLPPSIGGILVTLPPLSFTAVCLVLVASAANRGRVPGIGPALEMLGAVAVGVVYGATITAVVAALGPPDTAASAYAGRGWAPALLGVAGAMLGVMVRAKGWRGWWRAWAPAPLRVAVRAGGAALLLLVAGGAVAMAAGLLASFGTAIDLSSIAAPSFGDSVGLVLLSVAFLPNTVIAGAGYATGIGFQIGAGTYSPLGSNGIDLPALPLLAAVPDSGGVSPVGLTLLIFPLAAAVLIGWSVVRRLRVRRDRMIGAVLAAALTALGMVILAAVSGGGVAGSPWAHFGVPVWGVGAVTFAGLGVVSLTIAAVIGWNTVPWVHRAAAPAAPAAPAAAAVAAPAAVTAPVRERDPEPESESESESGREPETEPETGPDPEPAPAESGEAAESESGEAAESAEAQSAEAATIEPPVEAFALAEGRDPQLEADLLHKHAVTDPDNVSPAADSAAAERDPDDLAATSQDSEVAPGAAADPPEESQQDPH